MSENITINLTQPQEEITFSYTEQGEEITFSFSEAARGPQGEPGSSVTVDQTIIDGSTNAVSGNAVFDGLALKAPIANPTFTGIVTAPRITGRCDGLEVLCKAGLAINAGQVVYVTGASGSNIIIGLAQANAEPTSSKTIGISESTLAHNATGYAITEGLMTVSISAPSAIEGDPIWLSPTTAGGMVFGLANKPYAPNHIVYLGVVTRKTGNTVVEIYVKIQNSAELDELADVAITSPVAGQALMRGASIWENRSIVSADISDATASATPSTIVKRNAQGGAEFAGTSSIAVSVTSTSATAVNAVSTGSTAVYGESGSSDGGFFASDTGTGLAAFTDSGDYHAKFGDTSGDNRSFVARVSGSFGWWRGAFRGFLQAPASITSSDKIWTLPNNTGTVALTTDEMTPTAAGLTSKFGTNKATIVNGDKVTILDSAASDAPKHVLWSLIVSTLTTAFNELYVGLTGNQTVAGNKTFSGVTDFTSTTRPTSSGTGEPTATSLITREDQFKEEMRNCAKMMRITPAEYTTATASGGFAAQGLGQMNMVTGTTASAYARAYVIRDIAQFGSGAACDIPVSFAFPFAHIIPTSANTEYRFVVGEAGTGAPIALGTNPLSGRGFGFRIFYSVANTRREIQAFAHNGTTYVESAASALGVTTSDPVLSIMISSDGAGTIKLFFGVPSSPSWAHVRIPSSASITLSGGPTSANYALPAISHIVQNGATPPSAQLTARPWATLIHTGTIY